MRRAKSKNTIFLFFQISLFLITSNSCVDSARQGNGKKKASEILGTVDESKNVGDGSNNSSGGNSSGPTNDGGLSSSDTGLGSVQYEMSSLVDPYDGTYVSKLTIPKNYRGTLAITGINLGSLVEELVSVRFNFGRDRSPVTVEATVSKGSLPGLTNSTSTDVLILDLNEQPFENIRLIYDLYDYNNYDSDSDGVEDLPATNDPRDNKLYCRGLKLVDDPTFTSLSSTSCSSTGDKCLYAYAKVKDSGLYDNGVALTVSDPQMALSAGTGYAPSDAEKLRKCLPDNVDINNLISIIVPDDSISSLSINGQSIKIGGNNYLYKGPYRTLNTDIWEISGDALYSEVSVGVRPTGLFQISAGDTSGFNGIHSFLFPRSGKLNLDANISYFGRSEPHFLGAGGTDYPSSLKTLPIAGESEYMDGCNLRMRYYDQNTNEGIQSCNVSATIEIIKIDPSTKQETILSTSKQLKLQLITSSDDNDGEDVLNSATQYCSSDATCSPGDCCFNGRCWDKSLVAQCMGDSPAQGNLSIGESCSSDFQCSSLCCHESTGRCEAHRTNIDNPEYCNKSPSMTCIAKEFCRKQTISECKVYKTGTNNDGSIQCNLLCFNKQIHGDCINGLCVPPVAPDPEIFDVSNPDCTNAQSLPN